jgi:hypothetical protein
MGFVGSETSVEVARTEVHQNASGQRGSKYSSGRDDRTNLWLYRNSASVSKAKAIVSVSQKIRANVATNT